MFSLGYSRWWCCATMCILPPESIVVGHRRRTIARPLARCGWAVLSSRYDVSHGGDRMITLESRMDRASRDFTDNQAYFAKLIAELHERTAQAHAGGGAAAIAKHRSRNKLLARERIEKLCDPETPFLELNTMAANGMYDGGAPSAGIVTGIGVVEGQECVIVANDATVKGGTYFPMTVKKHLRAQEIAEQNELPCIYLVDAGQLVLLGNLLGAQMLLHREREVGAALDRRVVGDDHALLALDDADPGDDSG